MLKMLRDDLVQLETTPYVHTSDSSTESSINLGCARTGAVPTQVPFQCGPDCSMPFGTLHMYASSKRRNSFRRLRSRSRTR